MRYFSGAFFLVLIFFLSGCQTSSIQTSKKICDLPASHSYWKIASPDEIGSSYQRLCDTLQNSVPKINNLHSILIEKNGKLIVELYQNGTDKPLTIMNGFRFPFTGKTNFDRNSLHDVRSVSKSIVSLLYGIALEKKLVPELSSPVLDSFPELSDLRSETNRSITWGHLLTMASGLDWKEWGVWFINNDEARLYWKEDLTRYVFDRPTVTSPGTSFNYNGGGTSVLAEILTRKTGKTLPELTKEWILDPLEIKEYEWATDKYGRALAFGGLRLKPIDMLKIGRLLLNQGTWEKKQIVPKVWVNESTKSQILTEVQFFSGDSSTLEYGYQWWIGKTKLPDRTILWKAAVGNGGQRIYIIPELDMVVITTAGEYGELEIHKRIGKLLDEIIISSI
ncbi:serine hydrolase domain-containing protein [Leptospira sarikeiensis]|uniref:Class C beta-lactamase-related serine hydrolase n=1 Tax=Leptospira sarikeiensis TaxID=2484943 RepID=A0A4R9K8R6_9LEPT|nr:serine hydrolase [Leptospira sarikeiensis]TGL62062.1 class C beta-lactamase-related serine hydrolase [Leptospira sarikeiensis]